MARILQLAPGMNMLLRFVKWFFGGLLTEALGLVLAIGLFVGVILLVDKVQPWWLAAAILVAVVALPVTVMIWLGRRKARGPTGPAPWTSGLASAPAPRRGEGEAGDQRHP